MRQQVQDRVGDHALGRLDAAEEEDRGVGDCLVGVKPAGVGGHRQQGAAQLGERLAARRADRAPGGHPRHRGDDRVVPAQDRLGVGAVEPERARDDRGRQRSGELAAQLGAPRRSDRVGEPLGLLGDDGAEARVHRRQPERRGERGAVARVLVAVEREHARPDDPRRGEARVVDREGRVGAQDRQREVAPRDQPGAERRDPCHRLARTQAREQRVRVRVERFERYASAPGISSFIAPRIISRSSGVSSWPCAVTA